MDFLWAMLQYMLFQLPSVYHLRLKKKKGIITWYHFYNPCPVTIMAHCWLIHSYSFMDLSVDCLDSLIPKAYVVGIACGLALIVSGHPVKREMHSNV